MCRLSSLLKIFLSLSELDVLSHHIKSLWVKGTVVDSVLASAWIADI